MKEPNQGQSNSEQASTPVEISPVVSRNDKLPNVVSIEVQNPTQIAKHNMIIASSCGMCGMRNIEKMLTCIIECVYSSAKDR